MFQDSLCSWISEPESVVNNWRGWRKQSSFIGRNFFSRHQDKDGNVLSLTELAAREVASSIPFEAVEQVFPPVPEPLQLRIAFYSFPDLEEDIRLYSCLAHGSADEFTRGENLFKNKVTSAPYKLFKSWICEKKKLWGKNVDWLRKFQLSFDKNKKLAPQKFHMFQRFIRKTEWKYKFTIFLGCERTSTDWIPSLCYSF